MNVAEQGAGAEQRAVIELAADARTFVIAGPGAGKTWTLLQRAGRLAERDDVEPSEFLVLSFTRAVVRELRKRDGATHAFPLIFPETFDAFATRLLERHHADDGWRAGGFDRRIRMATDLIGSGGADDTLQRVRHILVDEVQDLVGPRAAFVTALLESCDGGFTAFGDPAQAIYDYAVVDDDTSLIARLETDLADEVVHLSGNRRTGDAAARSVESVRQALLTGGPEGAEAALDALAEIDSLGGFADLPTMLRTVPGEVAVLCRDNATALLLSRALRDANVTHRVRRGAADRPVAGWVAPLFEGSSALDRARMAERLEQLSRLGLASVPDIDDAWRWLSRMDPKSRSGAIRVAQVRTHILTGRIPYDLHDEPDDRLIVSSIHRAKGLEFDHTVILEWPHDDEAAAEARVLFVALSRARGDSLHAGSAATGRTRWRRSADVGDRFIKGGIQRWQTFGMEIRADDVDGSEPAHGTPLGDDSIAVQTRLLRDVRSGDPVSLTLGGERDFGDGRVPMYVVRHETGPIGLTGRGLGSALRQRGRRGPGRIDAVHVDDLETVAGAPATSEAAGLGSSGLWLRPRLIGLGEFDWNHG